MPSGPGPPVASVSPEVAGGVATTSVSVLATAPAVAMASLYQNLAFAASQAAANAVYAQQQANIAHEAVTARCVALLLGFAGK